MESNDSEASDEISSEEEEDYGKEELAKSAKKAKKVSPVKAVTSGKVTGSDKAEKISKASITYKTHGTDVVEIYNKGLSIARSVIIIVYYSLL